MNQMWVSDAATKSSNKCCNVVNAAEASNATEKLESLHGCAVGWMDAISSKSPHVSYLYPSSMFFDLLPCSSAVSPGARRRKADPKKRNAITSGGQMLPEMVVMRDQKRDVVVTMMQRKGTMML
jgi:hypothetical protein